MNQEIRDALEREDIVKVIKAQRLRGFEYILKEVTDWKLR